jgi:hypothetical protein
MAHQATEQTTTKIAAALNRGDVEGALEAVGLPRRVFLGGLAALVPAAAIASAAAATLPDDAELISLSAQISELRAKERAGFAECKRCHDICEAMEPEKPRALVWRVDDPIGHTMRDPTVLEDGSLLLWCDPDQIARIARTSPELWPDRIEEIVNAWKGWRDGIEDARVRSGYTAANEAREAISDSMSELYHQMLELRPTTLEGYKAFAAGILNTCWDDQIACGGTGDMEGLAVMMSSLTGVPLEEAA